MPTFQWVNQGVKSLFRSHDYKLLFTGFNGMTVVLETADDILISISL